MGDRKEGDGYTKVITPFDKNPLLGFTTETGAESTTYYSDYYYYNANGTVLRCGGDWSSGVAAGLWGWHGYYSSSSADGNIGGRLCYKPL